MELSSIVFIIILLDNMDISFQNVNEVPIYLYRHLVGTLYSSWALSLLPQPCYNCERWTALFLPQRVSNTMQLSLDYTPLLAYHTHSM